MSHGPAFWLPNIVQPIGTVLVGIAGSFIALRQWLTANEKFRFDLFEKRFEIYLSVSLILGELVRYGDENIEIELVRKLDEKIVETRLFYGSAIAKSLEKASLAGIQLYNIKNASDEYRFDESILKLQDKLFGTITVCQISTMTLMREFIDFSNVGRPGNHSILWSLRNKIRRLFDGFLRRMRGAVHRRK